MDATKGKENETPVFTCDVCSFSFTRKDHLAWHKTLQCKKLKTFEATQFYSCGICKKSFRDKDDLLKHKRNHNVSTIISCDICNETFKEKKDLEEHKLKHSKQTLLKCEKCELTFKFESTMINHQKLHDIKSYSCDICNESFISMDALENHEEEHEYQLCFTCNICTIKIAGWDNYLVHKKSCKAKAVVQFICDICSKKFYRKGPFEIHVRKHQTIKNNEAKVESEGPPFQCDFCDMTLSRKEHIKRHCLRKHPEEWADRERERAQKKVEKNNKDNSLNEPETIEIDENDCNVDSNNTSIADHINEEILDEDYETKLENAASINVPITPLDKDPRHAENDPLSLETTTFWPYSCDICHYPLRTFIGLLKHYKNKHDIDNPKVTPLNGKSNGGKIEKKNYGRKYPCEFCGFRFARKDTLTKHLKRLHDYVEEPKVVSKQKSIKNSSQEPTAEPIITIENFEIEDGDLYDSQQPNPPPDEIQLRIERMITEAETVINTPIPNQSTKRRYVIRDTKSKASPNEIKSRIDRMIKEAQSVLDSPSVTSKRSKMDPVLNSTNFTQTERNICLVFPCKVCGEIFNQNVAFYEHFKSEHENLDIELIMGIPLKKELKEEQKV